MVCGMPFTQDIDSARVEIIGAHGVAQVMHFMLETSIAARLIGIDAFDQPAVEEGKVLAKQYLAKT